VDEVADHRDRHRCRPPLCSPETGKAVVRTMPARLGRNGARPEPSVLDDMAADDLGYDMERRTGHRRWNLS
jgi:hypothetical protein